MLLYKDLKDDFRYKTNNNYVLLFEELVDEDDNADGYAVNIISPRPNNVEDSCSYVQNQEELDSLLKKIGENVHFAEAPQESLGISDKPLIDTTQRFFDPVNNPEHYATGKIQCIDAMIEAFGKEAVITFCKLNAFKYIWRAEKKNKLQDIEKANWYISKYIELSRDI